MTETPAFSDGGKSRFDEGRNMLIEFSLPRTDVADLIDYIDHLEANGYCGEMKLHPDARIEDVVFEAALHVGYQCGLREAGGSKPTCEYVDGCDDEAVAILEGTDPDTYEGFRAKSCEKHLVESLVVERL